MEKLLRSLKDEAATERLGADIAMALRPGDVVALKGALGAGKTTLARGLIRHLAGDREYEVPSPTYTLCQTYEFGFPLCHFDLYRLGDASEADELGLWEALETGAVLVEWPERAEDRLPMDAVTVELEMTADGGRQATISGGPDGESGLGARIARSLAIRDFLDATWGEGSERHFLQGDASTRRYETATLGNETRVVMDSPRRPDGPPVRDGKPYSRIAHLAEDVMPFIAVDEALRDHGFAAPRLHGKSIGAGLLLCEHLGSQAIVDERGVPVRRRYAEAARLLARLHAIDWPHHLEGEGGPGETYCHALPRYDREAFLVEVGLLVDWYVPAYGKGKLSAGKRNAFFEIWERLVTIVEESRPTLVLRDYHSPNLIWREGLPFPQNVGLIDFQDAVLGPAAYDLASLGQDARVDVAPELEAAIVDAYLQERHAGLDRETLQRDYAILAAQRASKILGIFVRLDRRDGKPGYLRHLPRLRGYLERSLAHPELHEYAGWCEQILGLPAGEDLQ